MSFKLTWRGDEILNDVDQSIDKGIIESILDLSQESSEQAPIESGDLRGNVSATYEGRAIRRPTQGEMMTPAGNRFEGKVGYTLPYALKQHEDLDLDHTKTDGYKIQTGPRAGVTVNMVAGGKAKYLEDPFNTGIQRYIMKIAAIAARFLK